MIEGIVKVDTITGEITFDRDGLLTVVTYAAFNKLLRRDRGSVGDSQGREKRMFLKELGYIHLIAHPNSYINRNGFTEKEADSFAKQMLDLPNDWEPDELVEECLTIYRNEFTPIDKRLSHQLIKALHNYEKIVERCSISISHLLQEQELTASQVKELVNINEVVLDLAKKVPDQIANLRKFIEKLEQEEKTTAGAKIARGGTVVSDSMTPGSDISM